jgi:Omp85 superfamily domain
MDTAAVVLVPGMNPGGVAAFRFPLIFALWLCALAPCALAQRAAGSLRLSVQAKQTALKEGDDPQLHWVLAGLPKPEDIASLTDETFRGELSSVLRDLAARKGTGEDKCLEIVVEERAAFQDCSLRDTLRKTFEQGRKILLGDFVSGKFALKPDPLKTKPATATGAPEVRLIGFTYQVGAATLPISSFQVELETAYAAAAAAGNNTPIVSRPITIPADRFPEGFSAENVAVNSLYTRQDRYPNAQGAALFTDDQVAAALTEVAVAVLRAAAAKQLTVGAIPDLTQVSALATQIEMDWNLDPNRTQWPAVSASVKPGNDGKVPIHVAGLRLVQEARVSLTGAEVAVNTADQSKLDAIRQHGADKLQDAHRDLFAGLRGKVPQLDPVLKVSQQLGQPKQVDGPFLVKSKDGVLFYEGNFRWVISSLDAKFDASLGLSPEQPFTAGGSITGAKLFYLIPRLFGRPAAGDLGESHSLTAKGGPGFQTIDYTLSRDVSLWSGDLLPSLDMDWKRDTSQRFGPSFQPVPQEIVRGIRPGVKWSQTVGGSETSHWSHGLSFDLGLPLQHTRLVPNGTTAAADLINAQVTALSFEMRVGAGYDFASGRKSANQKGIALQAGHANLQLHTDSRRGWQIMGGDFTYFKHAMDVAAVLPWGFTMPDEFQISYARGVGTAAPSTPLFELYRLGGSDNLRGMETGEFVGRNLSWEQAEFGYNLLEPLDAVSKWLANRKKTSNAGSPAPAPTADPATAASGGISDFLRQNGISTLLVKAVHDRGLVTNNGQSVGNLFSLQHAGHGWGVGIELGGLKTAAGNVSVTFLRAQSSASYVHPNGVWITGVRIAF